MAGILDLQAVVDHFDYVAAHYDAWEKRNAYYNEQMAAFVCRTVKPGSRVLDVGCGAGDHLAACRPSRGVGVDISGGMIELARQRHPDCTFVHGAIEDFSSEETFDAILLTDVLDFTYDIAAVLDRVRALCHPATRIILTTTNPWWDPLLWIMEKVGGKLRGGPHNFIDKQNILAMLETADLSVSYSGHMLLMPKRVPLAAPLLNTLGVRTWGLRALSSVQYMVVQPVPQRSDDFGYGCSVIVPCYNEEKNIESIARRVPGMGRQTELIFVNDGSADGTADAVRALQSRFPHVRLVDYSPNQGKGHAVQQGFQAATQEVVMILDADLAVPPEELPRFFKPLNQGKCRFVNGSRLVYPMERQAMRTLNLFGNKIFGWIMSFITQQNLTDTLCGTKALHKSDFERMTMGMDKWGDFDLLFGAVQQGNKILEVPVHYKARREGRSKMQSFRHGIHLLKACWTGFRRLILAGPPSPSGSERLS